MGRKRLPRRGQESPSRATPPPPTSTTSTEEQHHQTFVEKFQEDLKQIAGVPETEDDIRRIWNLYKTLLYVYSVSKSSKKRSMLEKWKTTMNSFKKLKEDKKKYWCLRLDEKLARQDAITYEPMDGYESFTFSNPVDCINWTMVHEMETLVHFHVECFSELMDADEIHQRTIDLTEAYATLEDCVKKILQGN
jgi:hypothetical protein